MAGTGIESSLLQQYPLLAFDETANIQQVNDLQNFISNQGGTPPSVSESVVSPVSVMGTSAGIAPSDKYKTAVIIIAAISVLFMLTKLKN